MSRLIALLTSFVFLTGCATQSLQDEPIVPLGDFKLGHNIIIASKMSKGPVSRNASEEEWIGELTKMIGVRFGRYDGDELYHFGISVEGYMLAPPGLPLVYSPKSVLVLNVTVWDDAAGRKLNDKPHQMTIFENTEASSALVGSGMSRDRQEQLTGLSFNAARQIEQWLAVQHEQHGWFTDNPVFNPPEPKRESGTQ